MQRFVEVPERIVSQRSVGYHDQMQIGVGFRTDVVERALQPALRCRELPQPPQAQRPVLPRQRTSLSLVYGSKHATRSGGSADTLWVATLIEIRHTDIGELQPGVIPFAPLLMEVEQSLEREPCADKKFAHMGSLAGHRSRGR